MSNDDIFCDCCIGDAMRRQAKTDLEVMIPSIAHNVCHSTGYKCGTEEHDRLWKEKQERMAKVKKQPGPIAVYNTVEEFEMVKKAIEDGNVKK